jgi:hypothetical protein
MDSTALVCPPITGRALKIPNNKELPNNRHRLARPVVRYNTTELQLDKALLPDLPTDKHDRPVTDSNPTELKC